MFVNYYRFFPCLLFLFEKGGNRASASFHLFQCRALTKKCRSSAKSWLRCQGLLRPAAAGSIQRTPWWRLPKRRPLTESLRRHRRHQQPRGSSPSGPRSPPRSPWRELRPRCLSCRLVCRSPTKSVARIAAAHGSAACYRSGAVAASPLWTTSPSACGLGGASEASLQIIEFFNY